MAKKGEFLKKEESLRFLGVVKKGDVIFPRKVGSWYYSDHYGETQKTPTRSSRLEVCCKKGVLRLFAKFTGKHLFQSLFFKKVAGLY